MDIKEHNLIMISDENGGDVVGNFLNQLYEVKRVPGCEDAFNISQ
jgi:hypothetical protein